MAATTPAAFDPKAKAGSTVVDFKAGAAILAGQVVGFHGTGVDWTVYPYTTATDNGVVGVALYSQATTGGKVAVACAGSIVKVCEAAGSAIDAGQALGVTTVAGCVITAAAATTAAAWLVGYAIEDIDANGTGYAVINPVYMRKGET